MARKIINCIRVVFQENKEIFYAGVNWNIEDKFLFIKHTMIAGQNNQNIYININNILCYNTFTWELDPYSDYIDFEATEFFKGKLNN